MERYRITSEAAVYFVTWSIVEWLPVFVSEPAFRIITDSLEFCHRQKGLRTNAFVIMPTHFHAIVFHESYDPDALAAALTEMRKFTGRALADLCQTAMPECFSRALVESAGVDRNRRVWQPSRHPVAVTSEAFYRQKLDYLHDNPVRKGLVVRAGDWRFSSARWYLSEMSVPSELTLSRINWD